MKQIMCSSIPFGGMTVLLVGNPAQLPPVKGQTLWIYNFSNADDSRETQGWENTEENWQILRQKCSRFSKGYQRWEAEGFNSPEC
eukprot:1767043-Ditylum_brightwellii.AAC.1